MRAWSPILSRLSGPAPLRSHLVVLVVGTMIPVVAFSFFIFRQLTSHQQAAAERRLTQSAHDLAGLIDREMASTIRALQALARSERLERGDLASFYAELTRAIPTQPSWNMVILLSPDGQQLLNTRYNAGEPLPAANEPESVRHVAATRRPGVGTLVPGRHGLLAFPVRVPVSYDDELRYVLTAVIEPGAVADLVAAQQFSDEEWTRTVIDSRGTVVARTRDPANFVGRPATPSFFERVRADRAGATRSVTLEGRPVYTGFSRAPLSDWTGIVVVPREVIDGPARRTQLGLAAVGGAMLLLSGSGAFVLSRRLARGIATASAAAADLASGRTPRLPASPVAEIDSLGRALSQSAELLARHERDRNDHLARADAARAEAEAASRAKDEFLAMLGHELRNPLAPIRTGVHLLTTLPPGDERVPSVHQTIERQVTHMTRLVDDLLDASRVARGLVRLDPRPLDLRAVVRDVADDFRPQFEAAGISLHATRQPDAPVPVDGDPTRLAQSLGNLLHNALKFTPSGGQVTVTLTTDPTHATLAVRDTGAGMAPDLLPRLFQPFSQGSQSLGRSSGGLGLGLALVRGLVSLHGGTVSAHSDGPTSGSTFTIRLPLTTKPIPAARPADPPAAASSAAAGRRVLIVEDLRDAARTLKLLLTVDGHDVRVAPTAADAISAVGAFTPDVVICDIGLPDMDGYDLCRHLRDLPSLHATRLIALTGYGQSEDVARAADAGFHLHLTKPVDVATLRTAVAAGASV
jgi:signal transduction histidine kinase